MKPCVDDKLDDLKRRQNGLPDLLNVVMEEEIARLPRAFQLLEYQMVWWVCRFD